MELLVKPETLMSYIYGPMFGNAESRLFLVAAQCFNIESIQKVFPCHRQTDRQTDRQSGRRRLAKLVPTFAGRGV
jgi:hypothetical protein